jgi:hypothetical protein
MTGRGPQLEFRVSGGLHHQQRFVLVILQCEPRDDLRVAAVERLREPQHGSEGADDATPLLRQVGVSFVAAHRHRAPVVAGNQGNGLHVGRLEPSQVAIANEVVRVLVMPFVADVHADVVEQRRILEPLALAVGQRVNAARFVEQRERKLGDAV